MKDYIAGSISMILGSIVYYTCPPNPLVMTFAGATVALGAFLILIHEG